MAIIQYIGLPALVSRAMNALEEGVTEAANDLVREAQEATPVESGALKASIHTNGAERSGTMVTATVQTGGEVSDYAAVQHERTDFAHPRGGQAKYIEEPLLRSAPKFKKHVEDAARKAF